MSATKPDHYGGNACADAIREMFNATNSVFIAKNLSPIGYFWWGNALKYLWRFYLKNGSEDLDKCIDCIKRLKREVYGDDSEPEPAKP